MRISDWSSDVCSSDLRGQAGTEAVRGAGTRPRQSRRQAAACARVAEVLQWAADRGHPSRANRGAGRLMLKTACALRPLLGHARALAAAVLLLPLLAACATAPGTGRTIFTGGLSEEGEADLGRQEHSKVLARYGGAYDEAELHRYVITIGNFLVPTTQLQDIKFTITTL